MPKKNRYFKGRHVATRYDDRRVEAKILRLVAHDKVRVELTSGPNKGEEVSVPKSTLTLHRMPPRVEPAMHTDSETSSLPLPQDTIEAVVDVPPPPRRTGPTAMVPSTPLDLLKSRIRAAALAGTSIHLDPLETAAVYVAFVARE